MRSPYVETGFKELYTTYADAIEAERARKPWLYPSEDKKTANRIIVHTVVERPRVVVTEKLFSVDMSPATVARLVNLNTTLGNKVVLGAYASDDSKKVNKLSVEVWPERRVRRAGGPNNTATITDIWCVGRLPGDTEDRWILMSLYPCYFNTVLLRHDTPPEL